MKVVQCNCKFMFMCLNLKSIFWSCLPLKSDIFIVLGDNHENRRLCELPLYRSVIVDDVYGGCFYPSSCQQGPLLLRIF